MSENDAFPEIDPEDNEEEMTQKHPRSDEVTKDIDLMEKGGKMRLQAAKRSGGK